MNRKKSSCVVGLCSVTSIVTGLPLRGKVFLLIFMNKNKKFSWVLKLSKSCVEVKIQSIEVILGHLNFTVLPPGKSSKLLLGTGKKIKRCFAKRRNVDFVVFTLKVIATFSF